MKDWRVDVPEGMKGAVEVRKFTVGPNDLGNVMASLQGRGTQEGEYTMLLRNGVLWMSDTDAEAWDHFDAYRQIRRRGGRVLVNGLGLGMIVKKALECQNVEHVDVVEIDPDVIALVGPTYEGPRCTIHEGDAYTMEWPRGTRWQSAWHDIWGDVSPDDLALMAKMNRKYGRRVDWQGCWAQDRLKRQRERDRYAPWNY